MSTTFTIAGRTIVRVPPDELDRDPRGVLWLWEKPLTTATYIIACDPTVGIEGWHRTLRTQDDTKTDNAAIEVIRIGDIAHGGQDVQVAEFAAPIDYVQCAQILNLLGRLYCGSDEDGQALCIIEVYPGPGLLVQRELLSTYGYHRLYTQPYLDTLVPQSRRNSPFGWYATRQSVRDLWLKGLHHIHKRHVRIHSPWLVDEMADCEPDERNMAMRACFGRHDDRVRALLLSLWAAHHWSSTIEFQETKVEQTNAPPWQASAITYDQMMSEWEEKFAELVGED